MSDEFHNKNGSLTMYALGCGYIEEHKVREYEVQLSFQPDSCFDVKVFSRDPWQRRFWLQRSSLGEARKLVSNVKGVIGRSKNFDDVVTLVEAIEERYMES